MRMRLGRNDMKFFGKSQDVVKIGVWGPPQSGKTTYLSMLQYADCQGWKIKPRGKETQDIYIEYSEKIRDDLEFVPGTIPGHVSYLTFDFDGPKGLFQNHRYRIVLPEAAGEHYEKPETNTELLHEMSRYQGIIWLVDPVRIDNPSGRTYRAMIQEWLLRLHEIQGGGTLKQYMAFCLTKMDLPEYVDYFDDPKNFCLDKLGGDVERKLEDYCDHNRIEFFSTSSIGFIPDTRESNIDPINSTKLRNPARPINLFDPFSWLFSSIK